MDTVSLEMAKKLRAAGWPQEGQSWWCAEVCGCKHCDQGNHYLLKEGDTDGVIAYAPTIEEIKKALPEDTEIVLHECNEKCSREYRNDKLRYAVSKSKETATLNAMFSNEVDLLSELWLALKEKNLL